MSRSYKWSIFSSTKDVFVNHMTPGWTPMHKEWASNIPQEGTIPPAKNGCNVSLRYLNLSSSNQLGGLGAPTNNRPIVAAQKGN